MPTTRPNVIYILSDEHRGQAMSHMGDPNVETPVMDRLAHQGASLSRAYANCPICTPSRGTLFSGRHAHCGPVSGFFDVFKATAPSTATHLRSAGYHSAYIGKWHCGVIRDQVPRVVREHRETYPGGTRNRTPEYYRGGFEDWFGFECLNQPFTSSIYEGDEVPPWNQGCDFSPLLANRPRSDGEPFAGPQEQLLEMVNNPRWNLDFMDWRGLVTHRFKYAFYETGAELLFDLESDPYEMRNLAPEAPDACRQMRHRLLALLEETREPYFDVLIEHGVQCPPHVISVADDPYRILGAAKNPKGSHPQAAVMDVRGRQETGAREHT